MLYALPHIFRREIYCPYLGDTVAFTSVGLYHLRYSAGRQRSKKEKALKFRLFSLYAYAVLQASGTLQEYRKIHSVEYWAFIAIVGEGERERVKVIVRRKQRGALHFWSIMPAERHKGDEAYLQ